MGSAHIGEHNIVRHRDGAAQVGICHISPGHDRKHLLHPHSKHRWDVQQPCGRTAIPGATAGGATHQRAVPLWRGVRV